VEFQAIDKVFNPAFIGRNPRFVAPIPVSKVDLHGRICLQAGDSRMVIGPEEVGVFFDGAEASEGGRAFFTLASRNPEGSANILPSIADNPNQFKPYESVQTVVTEYGIAHLSGYTVRERAQAIIDIAHPDDRQALVEAAKQRHILYPDQIWLADGARLYPADVAMEQNVKGGLTVRFRGIKPSDEEGMRRLFYRFSDEAVYSRYFHSLRTMPHAKMQAYVNVDWTQVMSIVGLKGEEGEGNIIAEGRYIRIPGTDRAEVVFVVDETVQNRGIATEIYKLLIRMARERGIREFVAAVLFSNMAMMKVFRKGPLRVRAVLEEGVYHLTIPLDGKGGADK
jgi:RimJ/RimL family protein N-acetyltransferase